MVYLEWSTHSQLASMEAALGEVDMELDWGCSWYREWYTWSGVFVASWPRGRLCWRRSIRCWGRWRPVWCRSAWRWSIRRRSRSSRGRSWYWEWYTWSGVFVARGAVGTGNGILGVEYSSPVGLDGGCVGGGRYGAGVDGGLYGAGVEGGGLYGAGGAQLVLGMVYLEWSTGNQLALMEADLEEVDMELE
nr:unnamed protein product [Callosobruchus chinensis]